MGAAGFSSQCARTLRRPRGGIQVVCLGTTKDGHPRHPLYVPSSTPLRGWPIREASDA